MFNAALKDTVFLSSFYSLLLQLCSQLRSLWQWLRSLWPVFKESFSGFSQFSSVTESRLNLRPHESQHARPPCPSPTPGVHSDSRPSSRWCHPAISSSVIPFSSCPESLPASGSFPMSQLFAWGGQSIGVSASASVLPISISQIFVLEITTPQMKENDLKCLHMWGWPSGWAPRLSFETKGSKKANLEAPRYSKGVVRAGQPCVLILELLVWAHTSCVIPVWKVDVNSACFTWILWELNELVHTVPDPLWALVKLLGTQKLLNASP